MGHRTSREAAALFVGKHPPWHDGGESAMNDTSAGVKNTGDECYNTHRATQWTSSRVSNRAIPSSR